MFDICYKCFNNELDIEEWQKDNLKTIPEKGNLFSTNNWRE